MKLVLYSISTNFAELYALRARMFSTRLLTLILLISFGQKCLAQTKPSTPTATASVPRDTAIAKLFEKPLEIKWIKYFKGRLDDAIAVDIAIGSDGKICKGYLTYPKSKVKLRLEGMFDSTGVRMEEKDYAGKAVTGYLNGTFQKRKLLATWTNAQKTVGSRLDADEIGSGPILQNCSDNKWSSRFITRYNNGRCDMVIVRGQNGLLDGFLWIEADAKTYRLQGSIQTDGKFEIEVLQQNNKMAAMMQGVMKPGQNSDVQWVGSGERREFKFTVKDHFLLGCYEFADYSNQYDALYPRTPCSSCNTWLDQQVNNWINGCKTKFAVRKDNTRNNSRASAWPEIVCWTDRVFSGYLTFSDTWNEQAQGMAYNFDLKSGKNIVYDDLFNKTFNAKQWLDDYAKKEMPKLTPFASDVKYRDWVTKEGFPMFTVRREGLELSTLFHMQYGRQTLLVPYDQLKPYMKKDNPVSEFIK